MAIPAYQLIPLATDQLSQSQSQILNNFTAIKGLIDIDHVDFANGTNYGKHNKVTLPVQATMPTFLSGELGLYNLLPISPYPITGVDELFINKIVSGGAAVQIPLTASILSTNNAPSGSNNNWTYLPSGILLKWSQVVIATNTSNLLITFTVNAAIPAFKGLLGVIATQNFSGAPSATLLQNIISVGNYATTGFNIYAYGPSNMNINIQYIAIGY